VVDRSRGVPPNISHSPYAKPHDTVKHSQTPQFSVLDRVWKYPNDCYWLAVVEASTLYFIPSVFAFVLLLYRKLIEDTGTHASVGAKGKGRGLVVLYCNIVSSLYYAAAS